VVVEEDQEVFGTPLFPKLSVPEGTISNLSASYAQAGCLRPEAEF
jgi:hypothetical protein